MCRLQGAGRFDFDDHAALNQNISAELANDLTSEAYFDRPLPLGTQSNIAQRLGHRGLVHTLQKTMTKFVVHLIEHSDDLLSQVRMLESAFIRGSSSS